MRLINCSWCAIFYTLSLLFNKCGGAGSSNRDAFILEDSRDKEKQQVPAQDPEQIAFCEAYFSTDLSEISDDSCAEACLENCVRYFGLLKQECMKSAFGLCTKDCDKLGVSQSISKSKNVMRSITVWQMSFPLSLFLTSFLRLLF